MIEYVVYDTKEHVVVKTCPTQLQARQEALMCNEWGWLPGEPKRFLVFEYNRGGA